MAIDEGRVQTDSHAQGVRFAADKLLANIDLLVGPRRRGRRGRRDQVESCVAYLRYLSQDVKDGYPVTGEDDLGDVMDELATYLDDLDVSRKPTIDLSDPSAASTVLWQAGIHSPDMETALEAVARCRSYTGWPVAKCARFLATAAVIGNVTGPGLLILPRLAQVAAE